MWMGERGLCVDVLECGSSGYVKSEATKRPALLA
jgi:hypothetical protein